MKRRTVICLFLMITVFNNVKSGNTFYSAQFFSEKAQNTPINAVLLLPASSGNRMIEYYEGFLLALQEVKAAGISVNLQVFDIGQGTEKLPAIFSELQWTDIQLIIGGLSDKQIQRIADFSQTKHAIYVIPFTSKTDAPLTNPLVYQINTPQTHLYEKASATFCRKYKNANIIFFMPGGQGNKSDFIARLQEDLQAQGVIFQQHTSKHFMASDLLAKVADDKENVIVASDDSETVLSELLSACRFLAHEKPETAVSLFGYPAWQVSAAEHSDDFFRFRVSFYSVFYADLLSSQVKNFRHQFRYWYSREMLNSYPKYGLLGYDTALYFLYSMLGEGERFSGLQTDFYFERMQEGGGWINTNLYWLQFRTDYTLSVEQLK